MAKPKKENRYANMKINLIASDKPQDISIIMKKFYKIMLNSQTNNC